MDPIPRPRRLFPQSRQRFTDDFVDRLLQPSVGRRLMAEKPPAAWLLKSPEPQGGNRRPIIGRSPRQEEQEHMVTNYPHSFASHDDRMHATAEDGKVEQSGVRVMDRLRQFICGLHGHDTLLHFDKDRMSLQCVSCGHESPGWELNEERPTVTFRGDA